ncbi:hypothetical protein [Vibrio vulnificus]|uniref:hypothetical protein n=1 Tax=Vibrio vulnificus TaxID=672 RepID=UPI003242F65C
MSKLNTIWHNKSSFLDYVVNFAIVTTVSLILSIISIQVFPEEKYNAIVFSIIITMFLSLAWKIISMRGQMTQLLASLHSVMKVSEKRLSDKTSSSFGLIKYCVGHIDSESIPDAWNDLCWDIHTEYLAINYEKEDYAYSQKWAETGLDIQNAKCRKSNIVIKKIFVVKEVDELFTKSMQQLITKHIYNGVSLSYITIDEITKTRGIRDLPEKLESLDFSIVNSDTLFIWKLDKDRKCENGLLSFKQLEVSRYKEAFNKISEQATPINHICDIKRLSNTVQCKLELEQEEVISSY